MKKKTIVTRLGADGKLRRVNPDGTLTLVRVKAIPELPDDFIEAAARLDPDNLIADKGALGQIPSCSASEDLALEHRPQSGRIRYPLSDTARYAARLEQGRTDPDQAARAYLDVIAHDPEHVLESFACGEEAPGASKTSPGTRRGPEDCRAATALLSHHSIFDPECFSHL